MDQTRLKSDAGLARRADIDGLRAIAVVPVVLYHAGVSAFHGGYIGVDIFFVISGFLITRLLYRDIRERRYSIAGFYERRIRRIFPALFVMMLVSAAAAAMLLLPADLNSFGHAVAWTTVFASNVDFYRHASYFAPSALTQPLLHTWSLGVEEQFYIAFPLLLFLMRRWRGVTIAWVLAAIAAVSFGLCVWRTSIQPDEAFYLPHTRIWELLLGSLVALAGFRWRPSRLLAEIVGFAGLGLIAFSLAAYNSWTPFPGIAAMAPCLGAAMLIQAGVGERLPVANRLLALKPLTWIGIISYSLYLWHWPVFVFTHYWAVTRIPGLAQIGLLVAVAALATASYWFVERPFRTRSEGAVGRRRVFIVAAGSSAAMFAVAIIFAATGGLPGRLNPVALRLSKSQGLAQEFMDCIWGPGTNLAQAEPCLVGPAGPPQFLIWGDSHAMALRPAAFAAASRTHITGAVIGYEGCPPLLGVKRDDKPQLRCQNYNDRVLSYLRANPSIRRVILAGWWPYYLHGHLSSWTYGDSPVIGDGVRFNEDPTHNPDVFRRGVARTFKALQGRSVAVLSGVPDTVESVPMAMAKQEYFGRAIDVRPRGAENSRRWGEPIDLFHAAAPAGAFTLYRTGEVLCGPRVCEVALNGAPLYIDDNHLSQLGALELTPIIQRAITGQP